MTELEADDLDRDELAERRRERDRDREPRKRWLKVEIRTIPPDTAITALACPACGAPVYVPRDSDRECVDCWECQSELVSRRALDGTCSLTPLPRRNPL